MSAPVIQLITNDTPKAGRDKINASLTSLRDGTVWLDPMSAQSGVAHITGILLSSFLSVGASPAASGAVRLENASEIRWAYTGNDIYRMRNNGATWDFSFSGDGSTWTSVMYGILHILSFPNQVTFGSNAVFAEITAPSTPSAGYGTVYAKADGKLYYKNAAGLETDLTAAAGGSNYSRGAGVPDISSVAEGFIRYDETAKMIKISINGAWVEL